MQTQLAEAPSSASPSLSSSAVPQTDNNRRRRRRTTTSSFSSSTSMDQHQQPPAIADADDSIVLSDLVRRGEASRLRRRGALRLDRNSIHIHPASPPIRRLPAGPPLFPEDSDSDEENRPYSSAYGQNDIVDRRHRIFTSHQYSNSHAYSDELNGHYILVCGAEVDVVECGYTSSSPFEPSILPIHPTASSSSSNCGNSHSSRSTNGCGSIIHFSASSPPVPSSRLPITKVYTAKSPATDAVVSLPAEYFTHHSGIRCETSACGCVKEGIGCKVCGNPLGTRWRFCERMAAGRRKPTITSVDPQDLWTERTSGGVPIPCPITPASPFSASTNGHSSTSNADSDYPPLELYTIFSSAVTAYPDPNWRPKTPAPSPPTEPNSVVGSPVESSSVLSSPRFAPSSPYANRRSAVESRFGNRRPSIADDRDSIYTAGSLEATDSNPFVSYVYTVPPVFDRRFTASPEPMEELEDDGEQPVIVSTTELNRRDGSGSSSGSGSSGYEELDTDGVPLHQQQHSLQPQPQPQPQPMSFYEQQVLGAWEREREVERRERQRALRGGSNSSSGNGSTFTLQAPMEIRLSRTVVVREDPPASVPWRTESIEYEYVYASGSVGASSGNVDGVVDADGQRERDLLAILRGRPFVDETGGDGVGQGDQGREQEDVDVAPMVFFDR